MGANKHRSQMTGQELKVIRNRFSCLLTRWPRPLAIAEIETQTSRNPAHGKRKTRNSALHRKISDKCSMRHRNASAQQSLARLIPRYIANQNKPRNTGSTCEHE